MVMKHVPIVHVCTCNVHVIMFTPITVEVGHADWDERKTLVHVLLTSSITGRSLREREAAVGDVLSLTHLHILVFLVLHYETKL